MLILPKRIMNQIGRHALQSYPFECCGLLAGHIREHKRVEACYPLTNTCRGIKSRYDIDPREYLETDKLAQAQGLQIIGIYHSHPDNPARPSDYDLRHAWPAYSYLIVSVREGLIADAKSWMLAEDEQGFEPEQMQYEVTQR